MIVDVNGNQLKSKNTKLEQDRQELFTILKRFGVPVKHVEECLEVLIVRLNELKEENWGKTWEELNEVVEDLK